MWDDNSGRESGIIQKTSIKHQVIFGSDFCPFCPFIQTTKAANIGSLRIENIEFSLVRQGDSNPQPLAPEANALSAQYELPIMSQNYTIEMSIETAEHNKLK